MFIEDAHHLVSKTYMTPLQKWKIQGQRQYLARLRPEDIVLLQVFDVKVFLAVTVALFEV